MTAAGQPAHVHVGESSRQEKNQTGMAAYNQGISATLCYLRPSKPIDNLRKHFQNMHKWIRSEKIHPSYAAEVHATLKTREAV